MYNNSSIKDSWCP